MSDEGDKLFSDMAASIGTGTVKELHRFMQDSVQERQEMRRTLAKIYEHNILAENEQRALRADTRALSERMDARAAKRYMRTGIAIATSVVALLVAITSLVLVKVGVK